MFRSPGLRLSLLGGLVFFISMPLLIVLPNAVAVVGMLIGGMGVWVGFLWTIFSYYSSPPEPPPNA